MNNPTFFFHRHGKAHMGISNPVRKQYFEEGWIQKTFTLNSLQDPHRIICFDFANAQTPK